MSYLDDELAQAKARGEALLYTPPPTHRRHGWELVRYEQETGKVEPYEVDSRDEENEG